MLGCDPIQPGLKISKRQYLSCPFKTIQPLCCVAATYRSGEELVLVTNPPILAESIAVTFNPHVT